MFHPRLFTRDIVMQRVTRVKKKKIYICAYQLEFPRFLADCIRQRQRVDYILITWNLVWMNTACYTTEYRQCLSPKGQLYLKADSEGKPDPTFNHYFRRSLVSSRHIYILHVYTDSHILYYATFSPIPFYSSITITITSLYSRSCHRLLACFTSSNIHFDLANSLIYMTWLIFNIYINILNIV